MSEKPPDHHPRGRFRALYSWLTGAAVTPNPTTTPDVRAGAPPSHIGRYAVTRKIGEGGMGIVYAARDDRLERDVAVKTMLAVAADEVARQRFWREARAAASVNHPNVCQIYEIGEHDGGLFIAMELLEGEVLTEALRWGPVLPARAMAIAAGILEALAALHARNIVHRDLKPSNVFLTTHGVKLLDFGLARAGVNAATTVADLTRTGTIVGTPRYMAPEQVAGEPIDARTDLFAAGAILFEMLAGRPAFGGHTLAEVIHATRYEQPPALTGSPAVTALDRIVRRALAKQPEDRPASADEMAAELRAVRGLDSGAGPAVAHALTRLIVLPFRVLRADPETDFLAYSLADAIATSLSGRDSLVVRSSAVGSRLASDAPDLKLLAREADVDRVVLGTLLRVGDQLRVTAQLVDAPGGTLLSSLTVQSSLGDLFGLQDDISRRVAEALALPLAGAITPSTADAPGDARAYELYLRANALARTYSGLAAARDLYQRCLDLDSRFAPAWAHLGRCHRVIGKYIDGAPDSEARAEEAFRRALTLSPRLSVAHKYYAQLESDVGQAGQAVERLLGEAARHGNDPELFAGLVHACRYCGLYDESKAAHAEARRLDPNVPTSFEQTLLMTGEVDRLLAVQPPSIVAGADDGIRVIALGLAGRRDEAKRRLLAMREHDRIPAFQSWIDYLMAWIDGRPEDMTLRLSAFAALKIEDDPEAIFQEGWLRCDLGKHAAGLVHLQRAVAKGYFPVATLATRPQFDPLRHDPAFIALLAEAEAGRARSLAAFRSAGGERLVGALAA